MNTHAQTVLKQAWLTCQRHWYHMQHALQALGPHLPVLSQDLTKLDDEQVQDWDQFIRLTHDYPTDDALKAAYMNDAIDSVKLLKDLLDRVAAVIPG